MNLPRLSLITAAGFSLLCSSMTALAQSGKVAIRTLSMSSAQMPELWAAEAGNAVALEFSDVQPSEPVQADRANPFPVFAGPLDANGKPTDKKPSMIRLPDGPSVLLLGWLNKGQPQFLPIADPFATAKRDDWLVINATASDVALQIGEGTRPVALKPGSHQNIRVTAPVDAGAAVTMATPDAKNQPSVFYSAYWPVYPDKRCIILIAGDSTNMDAKLIFDQIQTQRPQASSN